MAEKRSGIITLTTDFGLQDYYVGAIKGVIYQIYPEAKIVDITHEIPPQDIIRASFVLREIWRVYPPGTVHVAVVDPTVGSGRRIILADFAGQYFLVPDNGILTMIYRISPPQKIHVVANSDLFCKPVSNTFHGRDIFAPVAAHIARGLAIEHVGPPTSVIALLEFPSVAIEPKGLVGSIIYVDRFGNLMSNISADILDRSGLDYRKIKVYIDGNLIGSLRKTFSDVGPSEPVAYINSAGFLEIAINYGRAEGQLGGLSSTVKVVEE